MTLATALLGVLFSMTAAHAQGAATVVAVPWLGTESLPHQVYSGGSLVLQAVATLVGTDTPVALTSATWDPGDGTGPIAISVANSLALELTHTYTGAEGQPFTAVISVVYAGNTYTDTFKVVIAPNNRATKVNMAIDKGLWNLHKRMQRTTSDGQPSGFWTGYAHYHMAATAGVVQAFEINNHRESGDPTKDPYVNDVARGLRYILSLEHGKLQRQALALQNGNDPDANGNGYGLVVYPTDHSVYIGGQFMDALVASGTPNKTAETGQATYVLGRTYKDIVQDMLDGYSFGMNDAVGGWHYTYNAGSNDTSASHWWAIGVLAANVWSLDAPGWVKNLQWTVGVPLMQVSPPQAAGCYFGYTGSHGNWWGDNQTNVTAGGLILMNADGIPKTHARFTCGEQWLDGKFNLSLGNFYTMYQTAKAMRTARDSTGATAPITLLNGTRDWYAAYADYLIAQQNAAGAFPSTLGSIGGYIQADMASSWAIIILSPSLFELPPTAACTANPSELGTHGGLVNFSAAGSSHPDPNATIVSYSWDFGDGSPTGTGVTTSHTFSTPASFPTTRNVQVTVTDSNGLTNTASCPVTIVDTNVRPDANAGGPYSMCIGTSLTLNGSASTDEDGTITSYKWSWGAVIDFGSPNATTATVDATAAFTALGPGEHNLGLQVTDNDGAVNAEFTAVTVLAASNPSCNQPPIAQCRNVEIVIGPACAAVPASVDAGTYDPDGNLTSVVQSPAGPYGLGSTVVTLTATDAPGLTDSCTGTVSVVDGTPPTIQCDPAQTIECTGPTGANASVGATAADNCSVGPATCNSPSGRFPIGSTTVTCGATDGSGNAASCTTTVTVRDTTPPAIACPAPVVAECTGNSSAQVTPGAATASDICGAVTVSGPASGLYPLGTTTVTYTATDAVGLQASCQAPITVRDTTPPAVPSCNAPATITPNQAPIAFTATSSDTCSAVTVTVTGYNCTAVNGAGKVISKLDSCVVQRNGATLTVVDSGGVGDHITWTVVATDTSGNTSSAACAVDVINPGQGGGSKGNNGVGNGLDPQPPGNPPINDGAGTAPGNPGNKKR